MQEINELTYQVEHNPNCPSPFLIRTHSRWQGVLDKLHPDKTKDLFAYGTTFEEAAERLLEKRRQQPKNWKN